MIFILRQKNGKITFLKFLYKNEFKNFKTNI